MLRHALQERQNEARAARRCSGAVQRGAARRPRTCPWWSARRPSGPAAAHVIAPCVRVRWCACIRIRSGCPLDKRGDGVGLGRAVGHGLIADCSNAFANHDPDHVPFCPSLRRWPGARGFSVVFSSFCVPLCFSSFLHSSSAAPPFPALPLALIDGKTVSFRPTCPRPRRRLSVAAVRVARCTTRRCSGRRPVGRSVGRTSART